MGCPGLRNEQRLRRHGRQHCPQLNGAVDERILVAVGDGLRFSIDQEFTSPSLAGAVVTGRNTNGREAWKDKNGVSLKDHELRELDA